jgi:hypothetical protein
MRSQWCDMAETDVTTHMRIQNFGHGAPNLPQVLLPIFWEKGCERRFLGEYAAFVVIWLEWIYFPLE